MSCFLWKASNSSRNLLAELTIKVIKPFHGNKNSIFTIKFPGVREIMKGCREKANSFPSEMPTCILPQLMSVCDVLHYIFDRNACLLPAYFIITELQKQENAEVHWVSWT